MKYKSRLKTINVSAEKVRTRLLDARKASANTIMFERQVFREFFNEVTNELEGLEL